MKELPLKDSLNDFSVSIIVATYNRANYIQACLDSLLTQTIPAKEIIVVDDGSSDGTAEILENYKKRIVYIFKENGGKASAINAGLSVATGGFIWIFDDDDVALPDAIESRILVLRNNPEADFVYANHYYGKDDDNGCIVNGKLHEAPRYDQQSFLYELLKACFFHLNSTLVRRDAYKEIGGFDLDMTRGQDYDIQIRLSYKFKGVHSNTPVFIFRQHAGERGSKESHHPAAERAKIFCTFESKIGKKIRQLIPIREYIPRDITKLGEEECMRLAHLHRMVVMASKGCISEMFDDLTHVINIPAKHFSLSPGERDLISSAICTGCAYNGIQADWGKYIDLIHVLKRNKNGQQIVDALAFGLFTLAKSYPDSILGRARKIMGALQTKFL